MLVSELIWKQLSENVKVNFVYHREGWETRVCRISDCNACEAKWETPLLHSLIL
jgi:hypothetical protein